MLFQYVRPIDGEDVYGSKIYFFQFKYCQTLKLLYPFLYMKINFLCFMMLCFSGEIV